MKCGRGENTILMRFPLQITLSFFMTIGSSSHSWWPGVRNLLATTLPGWILLISTSSVLRCLDALLLPLSRFEKWKKMRCVVETWYKNHEFLCFFFEKSKTVGKKYFHYIQFRQWGLEIAWIEKAPLVISTIQSWHTRGDDWNNHQPDGSTLNQILVRDTQHAQVVEISQIDWN